MLFSKMEKVIILLKHHLSPMNSFLSEKVKEHFTRKSEQYSGWFQKPKFSNMKIPDEKRVLEVGCGAQFVFESARKKFGVDITPVLIRGLRRKNRDVNLVVSDARFLPFRSNIFYVVTAIMVLHHLVGLNASVSKSNIELCLSELKRVSEKKGRICILEHLANNKFISLLFFYITLICDKLNIELDYFQIQAKVITYYLDEKSFLKLISKLGLRARTINCIPWKIRKIRVGQDKEFILVKRL